jgi:orotate phosphoribosyltransferase
VLLALDRQERGQGKRSAVQEVEAEFGLRCVSLLALAGPRSSLLGTPGDTTDYPPSTSQPCRDYRSQYGV